MRRGVSPYGRASRGPLEKEEVAGITGSVPEAHPVTVAGGPVRIIIESPVLVIPASGAVAGGLTRPWTCCSCRQRDGHEGEKNRPAPE